MGMPRTLKNCNVFNSGQSYMGEIAEVNLPKLGRKLEKYRGGGMNGEVSIDLGQQALEMEMSCAGIMQQVFEQYATTKLDGVMLRFAGAYQRDDTGAVDAVEVVVRGRHEEIDMGKAKPGDKTDFKVKSALSYYKLSINGAIKVEIDLLNFVEIINGVDMLAEQRKAIGL